VLWVRILQERALGVCISGFVIRVKAFEIERAICNQMNKPCLFKASNGWMGNFLRRNRFVLRRITTTGRDLLEMQSKIYWLLLLTWKKRLEIKLI
jgi:hypothetical protein